MQVLEIVRQLALADEKLERRAIERLAPEDGERLRQLRRRQPQLRLGRRTSSKSSRCRWLSSSAPATSTAGADVRARLPVLPALPTLPATAEATEATLAIGRAEIDRPAAEAPPQPPPPYA